MKIEKLKRKNGRYDLADVPEKINEIIDLLNNSFITNDPDTIYGSITDSLSCDRLTPYSNETTCESTVERLADMTKGVSIYDGIRCPECGSTFFQVGPSTSTCLYCPPIIKDGVNINPDKNISSTAYQCLNCGHIWKE